MKIVSREPEMSGTSFQGYYLKLPYARIVAVLGEPSPDSTDGYKVSTEWDLQFEDGTVATVYDYKETNLYSDELPSPEKLRASKFSDWHIGGFSMKAVFRLRELFGAEHVVKE